MRPGTRSSPGRPEGTRRPRLENNRRKNGPKFFPCKRYPHLQARFAVGCSSHPTPSTIQIGKAPPSYSPVVTVGRPDAAFCLTCTCFSAINCVHGRALHEWLKEKMANYAHGRRTPAACYFSGPAGAPRGDAAECPLSGMLKHPDRSPGQDSAAPRRDLQGER